jgi:glycosyltransferase involved in cell wall biosynthesis
MKIGIDAKWYFTGPVSGVNVVKNLIDNLIKINSNHEFILFISKEDRFRSNELKNKIFNTKFSIVYIPRRINFITNLFIFPFYFLNKKIDVFLFQNYIPIWKFKKIIYVNYVHDLVFLDFPNFFLFHEKFIYKFIVSSIKKSSHVITISQSEIKRILKYTKISTKNISFVHHGVGDDFFLRSTKTIKDVILKYRLPKKFILYVGRINVRKNILTLLKAVSKLKSNYPLVIIGSKAEKKFNLEKELSKLKIKEKVHVLGFVNNSDLPRLLSAASLFVFPSFDEGFGLPPLEAIASGTPTIISDIPPLVEVCKGAALKFNPQSSNDLVMKIDLLLNNETLYNKHIYLGLERSKLFSWKKSAIKLLNILENLDKN